MREDMIGCSCGYWPVLSAHESAGQLRTNSAEGRISWTRKKMEEHGRVRKPLFCTVSSRASRTTPDGCIHG